MRRTLVILSVLVASFAAAAGAVAYFADSDETYDVVKAGAPIPWVKIWSQASDPVNNDALAANNLTYGTQNDVTPATPAATGEIDGTAPDAVAINLGDRDAGNTTWKKTPQANADVNNRFNRLVTVEIPTTLPIAVGQKIGLRLTQDNAVPALSSGNLMFASMEFATINVASNSELTSLFRGLVPATTVELLPGEKRQVNVAMNSFGQTDSQSNRVVNTAINVIATLPDGGEVAYALPITVCNHVERCA